eukprot:5732703-Pyramimonas_sp.AAC.1
MLTGDSCLRTSCTIGLGYCNKLCDSFNAYPAHHMFPRVVRRFCWLFMTQNRQARKHRQLPSKQSIMWRHRIIEIECTGGKQGFVQ